MVDLSNNVPASNKRFKLPVSVMLLVVGIVVDVVVGLVGKSVVV